MLRTVRRSLVGLLLFSHFLTAPGTAHGLEPGDLVVVDTSAKALVRIDPRSKVREHIAGWSGDTGKHLSFPWGLAWHPDGRLLLGDMNARAIFAIDLDTGRKEILSGGPVGRGIKLESIRGIALDGAGGLYASATRRTGRNVNHLVFHVDLATGARRVMSASDVGEGPPLAYPADLAVEADGMLVVNQRGDAGIYRIDPATGDRSVVSSAAVGSGPPLGSPFGIAVLADGSLAVTDRKHGLVAQVDAKSGDRRIVASRDVGSGPPMDRPFGVAQAADGNLYVADIASWSIYHVDLATGERSVVASRDVGSGPVIEMPRNLIVVPGTPRPCWGGTSPSIALALAVLGGAGVVALVALVRRSRGARPT